VLSSGESPQLLRTRGYDPRRAPPRIRPIHADGDRALDQSSQGLRYHCQRVAPRGASRCSTLNELPHGRLPSSVVLLYLLEPERAHRAAIAALKLGIMGRAREPDDPVLRARCGGSTSRTRSDLRRGSTRMRKCSIECWRSASVRRGRQRNAASATGQSRPRLFRLMEDAQSSTDSASIVADSMRLSRGFGAGPVAASSGECRQNKDTEDAASDYVKA